MKITDVKKAKALMQAIYKSSPYLLGKDLLGYDRFCETQKEWESYLLKEIKYDPLKPSRTWSLVLTPRETFKSSFWTVTLIIWALLNNPDLTILIANDTITGSEAFLGEIRSKLKSPRFVEVFGDLIHPQKDRGDSIGLITRKIYTKENNIETAGLGKSITGRHYHIVIADDIAGVGDRDSSAKRTTTYNFFNDIMDVLRKDVGWLHITGTRWHREDIYHHIIDKIAPEMKRKELGTYHIHIKPAVAPDGTLNYPRLLTQRRLDELKTVKQGRDGMDISTFMAQYQLNPMSPEEQIFKTFTYVDITTQKYERFVEWTDPALSRKETACYSVAVVIGKTGPYWDVLYASVKRRSPSDLIDDHNRIYRMHRDLYKIPGDAYMEDNGFQLLLRENTIKRSADQKDPVPTVGRINIENKLARIRTMEPYVSQGFIRFRHDHEAAPEGYNLLLEQLQNFPQGLVDGPDALQCAFKQGNETISFRSL